MYWSPIDEQSLKEVPFFIRGVVKEGVEIMAKDCGKMSIDDAFYRKANESRWQRLYGSDSLG